MVAFTPVCQWGVNPTASFVSAFPKWKNSQYNQLNQDGFPVMWCVSLQRPPVTNVVLSELLVLRKHWGLGVGVGGHW